jgi:hypothetical protein
MAQSDLIPMSKRSKDEVKKIASRGGVNSGVARRRKKELKERFKLGLEIFTELKARELKLNGNEEAAKIVKEIGLETFTFLDILQDEKNSPQIKLQAINDILDRVEGKATQKSVIDASVNGERELSPKEIELIKRQLEKEAKKLK